MKKYFNAQQIAKLEDITSSTVVRWIREGKFEGTRKVGREYRVPLESYHAWRESTKLNVRTNERTNATITTNHS
jgi:excisionase family DNA binding protein